MTDTFVSGKDLPLTDDIIVTPGATKESLVQRLTLRNVLGLARYLALWLRYRHVRLPLFFVDRGAEIQFGPAAHVALGRGLRIRRDFTGYFNGRVSIGDDVFFNRGCHIVVRSALSIGNHCLFGEMVSIHDENHVVGDGATPMSARGLKARPIVIGNNVWVGAKATILQGVTIGDNVVIGANAVVTHDIPSYSVAVGIPARVIRSLGTGAE